ncbi:hypothetical protein [Spirosoma sp. KNUC1025]|uniref:hypothetical protein n=1 Tax=Spirosoma sp. KNUC1025 TaxID=2894082 RepID=UPI003864ED66|nr:hypothetical protein LN737_12140 [Spirosoma sp. KNUC1025]
MKLTKAGLFLLTLTGLFCCRTVSELAKYQLSDGYYKSAVFDQKSKLVYIDNSEDIISIYLADQATKNVDTISNPKRKLPQTVSDITLKSNTFRQASLDIDFLTIPFKYRPRLDAFPRQFNTNLNGAVYVGYRNDIYQLRYDKTPLKNYQRQTRHYGYSIGLLTGLGGTTINSSVTNNQITYEYDGLVWSKGIAGIIGVNNFTIGLAVGFDDLLDYNKTYWIYQTKPWIGLAFGLNLN